MKTKKRSPVQQGREHRQGADRRDRRDQRRHDHGEATAPPPRPAAGGRPNDDDARPTVAPRGSAHVDADVGAAVPAPLGVAEAGAAVVVVAIAVADARLHGGDRVGQRRVQRARARARGKTRTPPPRSCRETSSAVVCRIEERLAHLGDVRPLSRLPPPARTDGGRQGAAGRRRRERRGGGPLQVARRGS